MGGLSQHQRQTGLLESKVVIRVLSDYPRSVGTRTPDFRDGWPPNFVDNELEQIGTSTVTSVIPRTRPGQVRFAHRLVGGGLLYQLVSQGRKMWCCSGHGADYLGEKRRSKLAAQKTAPEER